jgi:hypothetical protein
MKKFVGSEFVSIVDANGIEIADVSASTWRSCLVRWWLDQEFTAYYSYKDGNKIKTRKILYIEIKDEIANLLKRGERVGSLEVTDFAYKLVKMKKPKLAESKTCQRVKGFKKPSTNKRVKTYARKRK